MSTNCSPLQHKFNSEAIDSVFKDCVTDFISVNLLFSLPAVDAKYDVGEKEDEFNVNVDIGDIITFVVDRETKFDVADMLWDIVVAVGVVVNNVGIVENDDDIDSVKVTIDSGDEIVDIVDVDGSFNGTGIDIFSIKDVVVVAVVAIDVLSTAITLFWAIVEGIFITFNICSVKSLFTRLSDVPWSIFTLQFFNDLPTESVDDKALTSDTTENSVGWWVSYLRKLNMKVKYM